MWFKSIKKKESSDGKNHRAYHQVVTARLASIVWCSTTIKAQPVYPSHSQANTHTLIHAAIPAFIWAASSDEALKSRRFTRKSLLNNRGILVLSNAVQRLLVCIYAPAQIDHKWQDKHSYSTAEQCEPYTTFQVSVCITAQLYYLILCPSTSLSS